MNPTLVHGMDALSAYVNRQLLVFQHAFPDRRVASMPPEEALNRALGLDAGAGLPDRFHREVLEGAVDKVLNRFRLAERLREEPDNERVRLVYADWLLEQDDPRGELIHVEHRLKTASGAAERESLEARGRELRLFLQEQGDRKFRGMIGPYRWRDGYWDAAAINYKQGVPLDFLFEREDARFLSEMRIFTNELATVSRSRFLQSMTALDFSGNGLHDEDILPLVDSPYLRKVQRLNLGDNDIGIEGLLGLIETSNLPSLRILNLSRDWAFHDLMGLRGEMEEIIEDRVLARGIEVRL